MIGNNWIVQPAEETNRLPVPAIQMDLSFLIFGTENVNIQWPDRPQKKEKIYMQT